MILSIIIAIASMAFTMFCGIKYIHPGAHRGYADSTDSAPWGDTIKNKWWEFRDIPVIVNDPLAHVIRLWWWLATGINLKAWAAIHRHNSIHERKIWPERKTNAGKLSRAMMYLKIIKNEKLIELYSDEVPTTWIDVNLYYRLPLLGPVVLLVLLYAILGVWCLVPWLLQMLWLPFWRSESVNGWDPKEHEWNRLFHKLKDRDYCL